MIQHHLETPSLELTLKLTDREANLLRAAMSKAFSEDDCKKAGRMLFKSLRERESRFTLRELPYDRASRV
jgi:hypothetical protein